MSLIKIIANKIELDIVKETLTIVKENNAFISDFKVSYSNFPFLIAESLNTVKALGTRDLTSVNKPKIIEVTVEELGQKYYGELQILSYLNGFRKVTLKYGTELLKIMDKKISEFMPIVNVSDPNIGTQTWNDYPVYFLNKQFPEAKWQFPKMYWKNKYGVDLSAEDAWFEYNNYINDYNTQITGMPYNYQSFDNSGNVIVHNRNVPVPCVYLLSPLLYALDSINFKPTGTAYNDDFIKKIVFFSEKDNLVEEKVYNSLVNLYLSSVWYSNNIAGQYFGSSKTVVHNIATAGTYILDYYFILPKSDDYNYYLFYLLAVDSAFNQTFVFRRTQIPTYANNDVVYGSYEFTATPGNYTFYFGSHYEKSPVYYTMKIRANSDGKTLFKFNNEIKTGFFLPDWTFGTYLNELKNFFNLKIEINDFYKNLNLDLNESLFLESKKVVIDKSLEIKEYDQPIYDSFHLKFINDDDLSLWIDSTGSEVFSNQNSSFSQNLECNFKLIPFNNITANLSEEIVSKNGVGIMIYDSNQKPFISDNFEQKTLSIDGQGGIYENYWKKSLKFNLAASGVTMTGYFTEIELAKIEKIQRVYIDHQDYIVSILEYSETEQNNFEVTLKLKNINF